MFAKIATTASEFVSYAWERAAAAGEYWSPKYLCLAMCTEITRTAGKSVSYTWKRAAAAGEYWRPKYLCLASCGIAVSYVR